tara:strand:- start:4147 stop:7722 length:3576 start_codon:yes stop_codon:yes gene_type:complete
MFKKFIASCLTNVLVATLATLPLAMASADEETREFDIKERSLSEALIEFSEQSDMVIVVPSSVTENRVASATKGKMTPDDAIESLLEGTGLEYSRDESGVTIRESDAEDANLEGNTEADGEPIAMLMFTDAQDDTFGGGGASSSMPRAAANVEVSGTVTDRRTGAGLKGARVEVIETGQTATTDDLGRFRFPSVSAGEKSVRVSYLGYSNLVKIFELGSSPTFAASFEMVGGNDVEEIVVYGTRSSRALSLNQERTADNVSTVISADLLGNFEGTTISEALRRVPGIAFETDEFTNDGTNIIVRGLQADFNRVTLNGVELPESSGRGRSASLDNILADSVSKITINKTLLPSQDTAGTGGLVEIETKSPLDRPRRYASFNVEYGSTDKDFAEEQFYAGTVSGTFGSDDEFGVSLSVQYRRSENDSLSVAANQDFGLYLPLGPNQNPSITNRAYINPATRFPFEDTLGADAVYQNLFSSSLSSIESEILSSTISLEKQFGDHTNLRLDYVFSDRKQDRYSTIASFRGNTRYSVQPVVALDGEERAALGLSGSHLGLQSYNVDEGGKNRSDFYTLNGTTRLGRWSFDYTLGYSDGTLTGPSGYGLMLWNLFNTFGTPIDTLLLPAAVDPVEGRLVSAFPQYTDGPALPLLNDAGWAFLSDTDNFSFSNIGRGQGPDGENSVKSGRLDAVYEFDWQHVKSVSVGVSYERSRHDSIGNHTRTGYSGFGVPASAAGITELDAGGGYMARIGYPMSLPVLSRQSVIDFFGRVDALSTGPDAIFNVSTTSSIEGRPKQYTEETELAPYIQANLEFGKLEVIGGFRVSDHNLDSLRLSSPGFTDENGIPDIEFAEEFTRVVHESSGDTLWLPRIVANYRHNENLIVRLGYFQSAARPSIIQLSAESEVYLDLSPRFGPFGDQPLLSIFKGNPDLEPSFAHNYDLSLERYFEDVGAIKVGLFYKKIEDLFESNDFAESTGSSQFRELLADIPLPDDPRFALENLPDNLHLYLRQPVNAGFDGDIWGVELAAERQFTFLPGDWNGLGFFFNYTYTQTEKPSELTWSSRPVFDSDGNIVDFDGTRVLLPNARFNKQPEHSGTVAVTYNKHGWDGSLSYTKQTERVDEQWSHVANISGEIDSLDLRTSYAFPMGDGQLEVFFEASDLLKSTDDYSSSVYRGPVRTAERYYGGRSFRAGLIGSF